jgi:hypothetical protein
LGALRGTNGQFIRIMVAVQNPREAALRRCLPLLGENLIRVIGHCESSLL